MIGGLVTATFLTLVVLPLLYILFAGGLKGSCPGGSGDRRAGALVVPRGASAQDGKRLGVNEVMSMAQQNLQYGVNAAQMNKAKVQVRSAGMLPKTGVFAENEDLRPTDHTGILKIGVSQAVSWPGLYKAQKQLYTEQARYFQANTAVLDLAVRRDIRQVYYQLWYLHDKAQLYHQLDSIYSSMTSAAVLRVKTGENPGLDSISAQAKQRELQAQMEQLKDDIAIQQQSLMQILNTGDAILPEDMPLEKLGFRASVPAGDSLHPTLALQQQNVNIAAAGVAVAKNENRPEFSGRFFSQRLYGVNDPFSGFSVTASVPLFGMGAYRNKIKTAQAEADVQRRQFEYDRQVFTTQQLQMMKEVEKTTAC